MCGGEVSFSRNSKFIFYTDLHRIIPNLKYIPFPHLCNTQTHTLNKQKKKKEEKKKKRLFLIFEQKIRFEKRTFFTKLYKKCVCRLYRSKFINKFCTKDIDVKCQMNLQLFEFFFTV